MCYGAAAVVGFKRSYDAKGRGDDVDEAICGSDKEVRGTGAYTRQVILNVLDMAFEQAVEDLH